MSNAVQTNNKNKTQKRTASGFKNPVIPASMTWKCVECQFILGYTNSEKTELRIKFKDQYVSIKKAEQVSCACRRCGKWNVLNSLPE